MIPKTLMARSYRFAFLFSGQPQMSREDNLSFYDKLTAKRVDLPSFEQKTNKIVLQNVGGGTPKNILRVEVGHFNDKFRLFVMEDFPSGPMEVFQRVADESWKVFSQVWELSGQGLSLTEVTLRYTASAEGGNATKFLLKNCLKIPQTAQTSLGRELHGVGLRLVSPVLMTNDDKLPLKNADFNLNIETLLEDPSRLYIQLTTKWPSLPLPTARKTSKQATNLPTFLNPDCRKPSWYLKEAHEFLEKQIKAFLLESLEG